MIAVLVLDICSFRIFVMISRRSVIVFIIHTTTTTVFNKCSTFMIV